MLAGRFAGAGSVSEVSRAARSAPPPAGAPRPPDLLLDGLAVLVTEGRAAAGPLLRRATRVFAGDEITTEERLRWATSAAVAAMMLWDDERWHAIKARQLQSCREAGLLAQLVISLNSMVILTMWRGDFAAAADQIAEAETIGAATGTRFAPYGALLLAGLRGSETEAVPLIQAVLTTARAAGHGGAVQVSHWAAAVLSNGLGRYETALAEAQQATETASLVSMWALPELVEAASRTGQTRLAAGALTRLAEATSIGQTDWGQGIYARCRALLRDGQHAEDSYREAVDRLSRTRLRPDLARAHLLHGEWLRCEARRTDARAQLRAAHDMFAALGMHAFAERARRELRATGATVRRRTADPRDQLTPQEDQIALLARAGMSNPEIAAQLFLSARTVQYHLTQSFHQARDQLPIAARASAARRRQRRPKA